MRRRRVAKELIWGPRPKHLACSVNGCGRTPLCGIADAERTTFHCAACFTDGVWEAERGRIGSRPSYRSAEERAAILGIGVRRG